MIVCEWTTRPLHNNHPSTTSDTLVALHQKELHRVGNCGCTPRLCIQMSPGMSVSTASRGFGRCCMRATKSMNEHTPSCCHRVSSPTRPAPPTLADSDTSKSISRPHTLPATREPSRQQNALVTTRPNTKPSTTFELVTPRAETLKLQCTFWDHF
jgi:hypothetical protein